MRHRNTDTFELVVDRDDYRAHTSIRWRSRRYDVHYAVAVRDTWGDHRPLADFIVALVGGTLEAWEHASIGPASGREMAQALMPHWEREIHAYMEHLERGQRRIERMSVRYDDRLDELRYSVLNDPTHWWAEPVEDKKAKEKARQLLLRNLDAGQEKSFKKDGEFRVTAKDGKVYTIKTARSFNVVAEDGTKYCGQLRDTPVEDQMLAQKLLLQSDPDKFFKNANVSPAQAIQGREAQWMVYDDIAPIRPGSIVNWNTAV